MYMYIYNLGSNPKFEGVFLIQLEMGSSIHSLVEITSRKIIKPSSPTPYHLKTLKLSLLDQLFPPTLYGPLVFLYTNHWHGADFVSKASKRLQESLSKTLVLFYPLAGRLKGPETPIYSVVWILMF